MENMTLQESLDLHKEMLKKLLLVTEKLSKNAEEATQMYGNICHAVSDYLTLPDRDERLVMRLKEWGY